MLISGLRGSCLVCGDTHPTVEHGPNPSRRAFIGGAVAAPIAAGIAASTVLTSSVRAQTSMPPADVPSGAYVLRPDWVLGWANGDFNLVRDASVVVRDGVIEAVTTDPVGGDLPVRELPGQLLLPGFISGHTHVAGGSITRGIIEGGRSYARPLEVAEMMSDDELDALTAYNLAELVLSGCTTQIEMALSLRQAQSYARVAQKWGIRGYVGGMIPGIARLFPIWFRQEDQALTDSVEGTLAEIADNLAFGRELAAGGSELVKPMMTAHATDTHTPETMAALLEAVKELGTGLHIHLSQSARETETVKRLWGATPTEWLRDLGFFEHPVFAAHMSGVSQPGDFEIMAAEGGVYSHCPSGGGAGGGGGMQPYPEALAAGVKTNIGIDTHSNDYVENMKLAVIVGRTRARLMEAAKSPNAVKMPTIWAAVEGATVNAADALGRSDLGRIEAGARADLVSIDVGGFLVGTGATPPEPLNNLLYAHGQSVRDVIIDGAYKVIDGRFVADDAEAVMRRGGEVVEKLWASLESEDWFTPTDR
jgi:5-methylthioadenosine/S-adenosylhomocysteine deaminase